MQKTAQSRTISDDVQDYVNTMRHCSDPKIGFRTCFESLENRYGTTKFFGQMSKNDAQLLVTGLHMAIFDRQDQYPEPHDDDSDESTNDLAFRLIKAAGVPAVEVTEDSDDLLSKMFSFGAGLSWTIDLDGGFASVQAAADTVAALLKQKYRDTVELEGTIPMVFSIAGSGGDSWLTFESGGLVIYITQDSIVVVEDNVLRLLNVNATPSIPFADDDDVSDQVSRANARNYAEQIDIEIDWRSGIAAQM